MRANRENAKPSFIRRVLACLLSAAMVVAFTPVVAWGGEGDKYLAWDDTNKELEQANFPSSYTAVTSSDTSWSGGWYVANGDVTISQRVTVSGNVHLILADGCSLTVNGGIQVQGPNSLTIYAQSVPKLNDDGAPADGNAAGRLTVQNVVDDNAGIGGNGSSNGNGSDGGSITINGGIVTATSGIGAGCGGAGIGGGGSSLHDGFDGGAGGNISINGGAVTVEGMSGGGAGIGGGGGKKTGGAGGTISINGGTVKATANSSNGGAGIGAGCGGVGGAGGTIAISGGTVTATGGRSSAGIGGGSDREADTGGASGDIKISGGTVTATGGKVISGGGGAGIGGGGGENGGAGVKIAISGGTVTATGEKNGAGIGGGGGCIRTSGSSGNGGAGDVTINGGTVTATGNGSANGIGGGKGEGTNAYDGPSAFSTTNSGNAVIFASSISDNSDAKKKQWSGVIFQGVNRNSQGIITSGAGQVYGTFAIEPGVSFEVPSSSTLTVPENKTLTIAKDTTLTNNGTITYSGKIYVDGSLTGAAPVNENGGVVYYLLDLVNAKATAGAHKYNEKTYATSGSEVTLKASAPEGSTFQSWGTLPSGATSNGENVTFTMPSSATRVEARCTVNQYTITFDTGGGTAIAPIKQNYGSAVVAPENPTRSGYTFAGWDTEIPATMPARDMTITAKWTANYVPPATPQAATDCIKAIGALPDVDVLTLEDGPAIQAARSAYEALTDYQKSFVPAAYVAKLEAAEQRYADLVAVAPVESVLTELPQAADVKTSQAKKAVKKAQAALAEYASLTDGQKALVDEALIANAQQVVVKGVILIAKADKKAIGKVKDKAFSVKYGQSKSIYFKTLLSAAGTKVTYKKASGSKYITVSKTGKVTAKKGMKEDKTYTAKIKVTCGKSWKYVKATVKVRG